MLACEGLLMSPERNYGWLAGIWSEIIRCSAGGVPLGPARGTDYGAGPLGISR